MPFGRRHGQAVLDALQAFDVHWRAALASHEHTAQSLRDGLDALRVDLARRDLAVTEQFQRVVGVCSQLAEHTDADRAERGALVAAVDGLTRSLTQFAAAARPRGMAHAAAAELATPEPVVVDPITADPIVVEASAVAVAPDHVVEVLCRFGNRWVEGFEVCEMVADDHHVRYRLRRKSDGSILPTLFEEDDIRGTRDAKWSAV